MTRRTTLEYLLAALSGVAAGFLGLFPTRQKLSMSDMPGVMKRGNQEGWPRFDDPEPQLAEDNLNWSDPWVRLTHIPLPEDVCLDGMDHSCAVAYICGMYGLRPRLNYLLRHAALSYFLPFGAGVRPWTEPGMTGAEALARICGATGGRIRVGGESVLVYERAESPSQPGGTADFFTHPGCRVARQT